MNTKVIDYLYEVYCSGNVTMMNNVFVSALKRKESDGGCEVLINNLKEYIELNSKKLSSFFESNKASGLTEDDVKNLSICFYYLSLAVEDLLYKKLKREYSSKEINGDFEGVEPQDLFKTNIDVIKEAYENNYENVQQDVSENMFNTIIKIIEFVKEKKSIRKVFGTNNIKNIEMEDILYGLYDFHNQNNTIFKPDNDENLYFEGDDDFQIAYFDEIKNNCKKLCSTSFEKYRPLFISKKNLTPELEKVVFCKNLLEFYKTGVIVYQKGFISDNIDEYFGEGELKHDFSVTYGKKFDYDDFKFKQSNLIFNPNTFGKEPNNLIFDKYIKKDNSLYMGFLLSADRGYYLMHLFIKDVTKDKGTYEIQLNALPDTKIKNRVQLIRLDNWETQQPHKNVAKKLATTTHIHLYNHFDLLRGKENGNYDIAYNIEENSADFISSLNLFLDIVSFDEKLEMKVYKKVQKAIQECLKEIEKETEV